MRDFDRSVGTFLWGFFVFLALLVAAPMLFVALTARRADERLVAGLVALAMPPIVFAIGLGAMALLRAAKRPPQILAALERLRAAYGGEVTLPTLRHPTVQPRLVTRVGGRELEVRFVRMSRRTALAADVTWQLMVMLSANAPFRYGLVRKQLLLGASAWMSDVQLGALGLPGWDHEIAVASNNLPHAVALLRDPAVLASAQRLFFVLNRGPARLMVQPVTKLNYLGALYMTAWDPRRAPEDVLEIVRTFGGTVERLAFIGGA